MKLEGIDVFVEVVEAQSFTRAADRLGMPKATVSAKIARLEERLGVTLIRRTTRQLQVTPAGQSYYQRCVKALEEITEGEQELAEVLQEPSGTLRLTAPADMAQSVLMPAVEEFLRRYPKASVDLVITNSHLNLISEGIDLAVRIGPLSDSTLVVRKFRSGQMGLWASRAYLDQAGTPIKPADLENHRFIKLRPMGDRVTLKSADGDSIEVDFSGRVVSDDLENIKSFVERGHGIGFLPDFVGIGDGNEPSLVRLLPQYGSETVTAYFVYPAQRFTPQVVRAFIATATGKAIDV